MNGSWPDKLCPQHKAVSFSIVEPDRIGEVDLVWLTHSVDICRTIYEYKDEVQFRYLFDLLVVITNKDLKVRYKSSMLAIYGQ